MVGKFGLDVLQWAMIAPLRPTSQPGGYRTDDRRVMSAIPNVLRSGVGDAGLSGLLRGRQPSITASSGGPPDVYGATV